MHVNEIFEIVDLVIKENVKPNEAIESSGFCVSIELNYTSIKGNKAVSQRRVLDIKTLGLMTIPTLRLFIKEVINDMRYCE